MGHEFIGVVAKLGRDASTDSLRRPIKEGDRVAFPFFFPCHNCYWCVRGEHHSCPYRSRPNFQGVLKYPFADGGYSEYFYLQPCAYKFRVPDEVPDSAVAPVNWALA